MSDAGSRVASREARGQQLMIRCSCSRALAPSLAPACLICL